MRKLLIVVLLPLILLSCKKKAEFTEIDINKFGDESSQYVEKQVSMTGMVIHVCKHGGKKMHLIGENPDMPVQVMAGEGISEFPVELEGKKVKVYGVIKEEIITEATILEWEAEMKEAEAKEVKDSNVTEEQPAIEVDAKTGKPVNKTVAAETPAKAEVADGEVKKESNCPEEAAAEKEGKEAECTNEDPYADLRKQISESPDKQVKRYWFEVTKFEEVKEEAK